MPRPSRPNDQCLLHQPLNEEKSFLVIHITRKIARTSQHPGTSAHAGSNVAASCKPSAPDDSAATVGANDFALQPRAILADFGTCCNLLRSTVHFGCDAAGFAAE